MKIIQGPIFPIPVPFNENETIDFSALESYCDYLVQADAKHLLVTVGTSRFNLLTRDEMLNVNRVVAKSTEGTDALAIAAGPGPCSGSLQENIEFAQKAYEYGAQGIISIYPERWYGDDDVVKFFHDLAELSKIGVWAHAVPMRDGFGGVNAFKPFGPSIVERIIEHPNMVGIKEENGNRDIFEEILRITHNRVSVIGAGGAMRRFMRDCPLGATNYLVGIESIMPSLGIQFYNAMIENRINDAENLAAKIEDPFFTKAVEFGWHPSLKTGLHIMKLMQKHERQPFPVLEKSQVEVLAEILKSYGWIA